MTETVHEFRGGREVPPDIPNRTALPDADSEPSARQWPEPPAEEAYLGLAGEVVRLNLTQRLHSWPF
jgi:hypothetical protein